MGKREYWQGHVERYGVSGLSVESYCAKERLTKSTFDYWKTRFKRELPSESAGFVAVTPAAAAAASSSLSVTRLEGVTIELPGGAVIRVADSGALDTVLKALQSSLSSC